MTIGWSVGIGITNLCNLNCRHCYSRHQTPCSMPVVQIERLLSLVPVDSINFGTGESGLHPSFENILEAVSDRKIKASLTSNGYTINKLPDELVRQLHDADISLDFATEKAQDEFRGNGVWRGAINALEKCRQLGVEVSIVMTLMNVNCDQIDGLLQLARQYQTSLRINIYKPVRTFEFALSYDQFWNSIATLFDNSRVIACSEPVVNAFTKLDPQQEGTYCGKHSIRLWPDGGVIPCVYWSRSDVLLGDFCKNPDVLRDSQEFQAIRYVPEFCKQCEFSGICEGGCPARRLYHSNLAEPDPYCPIVNGRSIPKLSSQVSTSSFEYVHATYLCTVIVEP